MNERIRELRRALGLTQAEFGERIGLKGSTVTCYESGVRTPSPAALTAMCREFHVSESWLREGTGEMFPALSEDEALSAFMGQVLFGESDSFPRRLLGALARLDKSEWALLEKIAGNLPPKTDS